MRNFDMLGANGNGMNFGPPNILLASPFNYGESQPIEWEITNKTDKEQEITFCFPMGGDDHKWDTEEYSVISRTPGITVSQVNVYMGSLCTVVGMFYIEALDKCKMPAKFAEEWWDGVNKKTRKEYAIRLNMMQNLPDICQWYGEPNAEPMMDIKSKWTIVVPANGTIRVSCYPCMTSSGTRDQDHVKDFARPGFSNPPQRRVVAGSPMYPPVLRPTDCESRIPPTERTSVFKPLPKWWQLFKWMKIWSYRWKNKREAKRLLDQSLTEMETKEPINTGPQNGLQ